MWYIVLINGFFSLKFWVGEVVFKFWIVVVVVMVVFMVLIVLIVIMWIL